MPALTILTLILIAALFFVARRTATNVVRDGPEVSVWVLVAVAAALVAVNMRDVGTSTSGLIALADLILFLTCMAWLLWPRA
jgi:hypothetical protein